MSYFSRNTTQPLIKNNKDYKVQSHIISIQSEDRDVLKWPSSSEFEVELPLEYKNICGITVLDMQMPNTFYTFNTRILIDTDLYHQRLFYSALLKMHLFLLNILFSLQLL